MGRRWGIMALGFVFVFYSPCHANPDLFHKIATSLDQNLDALRVNKDPAATLPHTRQYAYDIMEALRTEKLGWLATLFEDELTSEKPTWRGTICRIVHLLFEDDIEKYQALVPKLAPALFRVAVENFVETHYTIPDPRIYTADGDPRRKLRRVRPEREQALRQWEKLYKGHVIATLRLILAPLPMNEKTRLFGRMPGWRQTLYEAWEHNDALWDILALLSSPSGATCTSTLTNPPQ